jgi:hypothetical protein
LSGQSVITRAVAVAAGVFAPGHLGELTQIVPFEMVDEVLAGSGRTQRRVRLLPSRVVVYFLLAMALFAEVGYRGVWAKLVAGLDGLGLAVPSTAALRQARRRVGIGPLRALSELLAGPLAGRRTPGVWWRGLRVVAFDGTSVAVADSSTNRAWAGKQRSANRGGAAVAGYPLLRLVALVECGTRALVGVVFGPPARGELSYATALLQRLRPGMVLLADRNFDAGSFLASVAATGADLLIRLKANRRPVLLRRWRDGSIGSVIAGVGVRVVEATVTVTGADGSRRTEPYRLVTTLLDPDRYPAEALIRLYHQRWEIESVYLAIKDTILGGRVLRSKDPAGVEQELWALLVVYQALRIAISDATDSLPGTDPDRASFTTALHAARDQVTAAHGVLASSVIDLVGRIGHLILANLLGPRRLRISPRTVKRPLSSYAYNTSRQPTATTKITIHIAITDAATSPLTRGWPP